MILTGWKEIAAYLRVGVRTAQRRCANGMPVHRINRSSRSPVVADSRTLDLWISGKLRPTPTKLEENIKLSRQLRTEAKQLRAQLRATVTKMKERYAKVAPPRGEHIILW